MTNSERSALVRVVDSYWRGARLALLFDYDGTLVPIEENPAMTVLSPDTRRRLEHLARTPAVFVGILSGRRIDDLKSSVGISGAYYVGTSGLELDLRGEPARHPDSARAAQLVLAVEGRVRQAILDYPGAWVEQKPMGLTVHYRGVATELIDALRTRVSRAIESFSPKLRVLEGPMAIEITPDLGWTKGSALEMIVEHISTNTVFPVYAGDDANDADALNAAAALGGVAIGIGPRAPSTAQYYLPDPRSLACFLDALLKILKTGHAKGLAGGNSMTF